MPRSLLILSIWFALITSCQPPLEPSIGTDKDYVGVGESIRFSNINDWRSSQYIWDFGDGAVSVSERPTHAYTEVGTYVVKLIEHDDGERKRTAHEVHVGEHVLKSININFITDSENFRNKLCDRLYFLDGNMLLASNFGDSCYNNLDYTKLNISSNQRLPVSTNPEFKFIHSFFISSDSNQPWQSELKHDTLLMDTNVVIDFANQVVYENVLFFGRNETFNVDMVFPLYIEHE